MLCLSDYEHLFTCVKDWFAGMMTMMSGVLVALLVLSVAAAQSLGTSKKSE